MIKKKSKVESHHRPDKVWILIRQLTRIFYRHGEILVKHENILFLRHLAQAELQRVKSEDFQSVEAKVPVQHLSNKLS
jgi:hypothetical protein